MSQDHVAALQPGQQSEILSPNKQRNKQTNEQTKNNKPWGRGYLIFRVTTLYYLKCSVSTTKAIASDTTKHKSVVLTWGMGGRRETVN